MGRSLKNRIMSGVLGIVLCCTWSGASVGEKLGDEPIVIHSDQATFDQGNGIVTYSGHVEVEQGYRKLLADSVVLKRNDQNQITLMTATGNPARFKSLAKSGPIGHGKAKVIKYYPLTDKVDLINDAQLTQGDDTIRGPFLTYDFKKAELKSKSSKKQRSTVIIKPKRVS